jgi:hypothetical protein
MSEAEEQIRSALRLLEPGIADFEARLRAAAVHVPGEPALRPLRDALHLLRAEQQRLREQLKQFNC